jgi:hypothetical protein
VVSATDGGVHTPAFPVARDGSGDPARSKVRPQQGPFVDPPCQDGPIRLEVGQEVLPPVGLLEPADQRLGEIERAEIAGPLARGIGGRRRPGPGGGLTLV